MCPFVFADGRVSAFSGGCTVIPAGIHILPTLEYGEEKLNFLLRGAVRMDRGGMRTFYGTAAPQRLGACRPLTTVVLTKDLPMSSIQRWENLKEGVFLPIDQRLSVHTQLPSTIAFTFFCTLFFCRFRPDKSGLLQPYALEFGWQLTGSHQAVDPHHCARYTHWSQ